MDYEQRAILHIGDAAARVVAAQQELGGDPQQLWARQLDYLRGLLGDDWRKLNLDALSDRTRAPTTSGRKDALLFGERVAEFVSKIGTPEIAAEARKFTAMNEYTTKKNFEYAGQAVIKVLLSSSPELRRQAPSQDLLALKRDVPQMGRLVESLEVRRLVTNFTRRLGRDIDASSPAMGRRSAGAFLAGQDRKPEAPTLTSRPKSARSDAEPLRRETYVNIGLAPASDPTVGLDVDRLIPDTVYWVWVEVGPRVADAVTGDAEPVRTRSLRRGELIDVVLLGDDGLELSPPQAVGRLRMVDSESFEVVQPATTFADGVDEELAQRRLWFGLRTPPRSGNWRVRCMLVVRGVIVHVEQLTVAVGDDRHRVGVQTTYRIVGDLLSDAGFAALRTPTLSIYANAGDATHDFSFVVPEGDGLPYTKQVPIDATELITLIDQGRTVLGKIAWGSTKPYGGQEPAHRLGATGVFESSRPVEDQLIELAVAGKRLWMAFATAMERDVELMDRLQKRMRQPGAVQLAPKEDPRHLVPLQLLYDFALDDTDPSSLSVCDATASWLADGDEDLICFEGACPSEGDDGRVCLAGFWGYRHAVSLCVSRTAKCTQELNPEIPSSQPPRTVVFAATDPKVVPFWAPHKAELDKILDINPQPARDVPAALTALMTPATSLVYCLTHVVNPQHPMIKFNPAATRGISANTLFDKRVDLCPHRPLVFVNACESAGLSPEKILGLIDRFIMHGASGAVGTEITVFAGMATKFAESFLHRFASGTTLAESLRQARLDMIRLHNPLGLAYVGFGLQDLRLVPDVRIAA